MVLDVKRSKIKVPANWFLQRADGGLLTVSSHGLSSVHALQLVRERESNLSGIS